MRLSFKQLRHYIVETAGGIEIGHVRDVIFEIDGQTIVQYVVRSAIIGGEEYLVHRDQIIRFEPKKLIVQNNSVHDVPRKVKKQLGISPEAVSMREEV